MRRFFVKNLLFIITVNVLIKPVWFLLIDRTVQNRLGHEKYGSYPQLFNIALILQIVLDFGLTSYNNRTIAQQPDRLRTLFPVMLTARMVLMLVYISLACIVAWAMGITGGDLILLVGVLFIQIFNSLLQFLRSNISALLKFKADGVLSVLDRFLVILICGFLLVYPATARHFKLAWFIEAQIAAYLLASVAAFFILRGIVPVKLRLSFDWPLVSSIIRQSWPYASLIFLMSIYMRADMVMLGRLCGGAGKDQVSIYTSAYRLLDICNMFGIMFAGVLLPLFGRMLAQKANIFPIVQVSANMLLPFAFTTAVAAAFWGVPVMHRLYPSATAYDGRVFAWVMACFPSFCVTYVYCTLLTSNGSLKLLNKIALVGTIINLSLNFWLIPRHYAIGAAFTAFITQTILALCFVFFAGKTVHIPLPPKWALSHFLFLILIIALAYGINAAPLNWIFQTAIFGVVCMSLIVAFRFISLKAIKQLLVNK